MATPDKSNYKRGAAKISQTMGRAVYQMTGGDNQKNVSKGDYARKGNPDIKKTIGGGNVPLPKPAAAAKSNYVRKSGNLNSGNVPMRKTGTQIGLVKKSIAGLNKRLKSSSFAD